MTESKPETTSVTPAGSPTGVLALLPRLEEVRDIIQASLQGGTVNEFQLDRVRVPGAGGTTWTIPGLEGETESKTIAGIIVGFKNTRGYWAKPYSAANPAPPDCASNDALTGNGNRGEYGEGPQDCLTCPLAEWGSKVRDGVNVRSQACKTMMVVFILTANSLIPTVLTVPPSSLKYVQPYPLRLAGQGLGWWAVITEFTLEKREVGGYPTAVIKPRLVSRLDHEQAEQVRRYKDAIAPMVRRATVDVEGAVLEDD